MLELIQYWMKWWKHIAIFCGTAILLSIIITTPAIMHPYYQSKMVFYPANPATNDRGVLFSEGSTVVDNFGSKDDINRFLAIANSKELTKFMVDSFNLRKHYGIKEKGYYYVGREFSSNYKAIRNDLGAIELKILDTDPELAAKMVKAAVNQIDKSYRLILSENKKTTYEILNNEAEWAGRKLRALADSLNQAKKGAVFSYDKDGNLLGEEKLRMLDKEFQNQNAYIGTLYSISNQFNISMSDRYPTIYVVEDASIAEKKTKPVRWLIVLFTAIGSFLAATIVIILLELLKHAKLSNSTMGN
ncbi:MAG: hypothetical protein LC105_01300 [Chitinophagales bacterium]|nr:hypothetical protein [Chitinophagales bacterium]MCZ2392483.1 hypothetical protein [Chitinophagales bacterium]